MLSLFLSILFHIVDAFVVVDHVVVIVIMWMVIRGSMEMDRVVCCRFCC